MVGEVNRREARAVPEDLLAELGQVVGEFERLEANAPRKGRFTNRCDAVRLLDCGEMIAAFEGACADVGHGVGQLDGNESSAVLVGIFLDFGDAVDCLNLILLGGTSSQYGYSEACNCKCCG